MNPQDFHLLKLIAYTIVASIIFVLIYLQIKAIKREGNEISLWKTYRLLGWFLILFGFLFTIISEYLYLSGYMGTLKSHNWEEKIRLVEIIIPPGEFSFGIIFLAKSMRVFEYDRDKVIRPRTWDVQKIVIIFTVSLTLPIVLPILIGNLVGI
jgi:hypothetical protein